MSDEDYSDEQDDESMSEPELKPEEAGMPLKLIEESIEDVHKETVFEKSKQPKLTSNIKKECEEQVRIKSGNILILKGTVTVCILPDGTLSVIGLEKDKVIVETLGGRI